MVTKITPDLFSSIAIVTSAFAVKGLIYSRTNDTFCLLFTLKFYCLVFLNYCRLRLSNSYFQGFKKCTESKKMKSDPNYHKILQILTWNFSGSIVHFRSNNKHLKDSTKST